MPVFRFVVNGEYKTESAGSTKRNPPVVQNGIRRLISVILMIMIYL